MVGQQISQPEVREWVTVAQYAKLRGVCWNTAQREINRLRAAYHVRTDIKPGNHRWREYYLPDLKKAKLKVST